MPCALLRHALLALLLWPVLSQAATYYVAHSGSDANPGTQDAPMQTIDRGVSVLRPGDTLYLRGGTYHNQSFGQYAGVALPSGTSWDTAVTIAGYPGEQVVIAGRCVILPQGMSAAYVIFDNLICDANTAAGALHIGADSHHIRFQNGEITGDNNTSGDGMLISGKGPYLEILRSKIHGAGGSGGKGCRDPYGCYAAYYAGHSSLWEDNDIYDNAGTALNIYNSHANDVSWNVIRNNRFWGNGFVDARPIYGTAIILCCGEQNQAVGNHIVGNAGGIQVDYRCRKCLVAHNTIVDNTFMGAAGVFIGPAGVVGTHVHDNLLCRNGGTITNDSDPTPVFANNQCDGPGPGCLPLSAALGGGCPTGPPPRVGLSPPVIRLPVPRNLRALTLVP